MGANQSMPPGYRGGSGSVKLRRRSSTTGVTSDELITAGVELHRAVAQSQALEQQRLLRQQQLQQQQQPQGQNQQQTTAAPPPSASPAHSTASAPAGSVAAAAAAPTPPLPPSAGTTPHSGALPLTQSRTTKKAPPAAYELPPWEIVANLSDTDWFAIRAWIESGWKCRKCGHMRDDYNDHPKATRLLGSCGVWPPQLRGQRGASTSSSSVQPGTVEYASTSPDNQVGYLSDSSPSSSHQSSPLHPRAPRYPTHQAQEADSSPRFHADQAGSPFEDRVPGVEACPHLASIAAQGGDAASAQMLPPRTASGLSESAAAAAAAAAASVAGPGTGKWDGLRAKVLHAITRAQQVYFMDKEPNGSLVFDFLLSALLDCTQSGYGFISSALLKADGTPYLKTHAMSNVAWTKELRAWYAANAHKGLVFTNMNTLHGSIVLTGQPVITNDPANDPRSRGIPPGHPPLDAFMGIPLYTGTELIGIYGLANRGGDGYSEQMMKELEPLTFTVAQMIYAVNERKRRKEAELHLASVVQVAKEGICSLSHSGHVTSMNFSARVMFGFAKEDEKTHDSVPPPSDLMFQDVVLEIDGRTDYLQHGLEHHSGHVHKGRGKRADGSLFPLEVSISRGTYDTVFFVAVLRDMSEQVETEHKLHDMEERWQYQVSGFEDGVWDWNLDQDTFFFSARWFQNLGYGVAELSASIETWDLLMHPDDKEQAYSDLKDHLDGITEAYTNEHRLRCKDGTYRWFCHRGRVVHRSDVGEPVHFVGTHHDITDKRKFQDASMVVKEATHHLLRLEAEYLARAGMDVHEPAMQILESAKELSGTELSVQQREKVESISECGNRLVGVVKDMEECSEIESGKVELDYHIFAVSEVVETAVLIMADRASAKGLETVIEMTPDTPLFIVSDANHCMEVLINLLAATVHGVNKGYVRVRLSAEMVFPHHDDDDEDDVDGGGDSLSEAEVRSETATSASENDDVLDAEHHQLHGPQLHLVITVDGTSSSQAAMEAEKSLAIQTPLKLLPLLGGSLNTMIDSKRGAIYTARIPVNSHHPEYKGAMAMRAAKPLHVQDPLLHARVLVVGSIQVSLASIGKQLDTWHIPHVLATTSPESAFLKVFQEGKLPKVVLPPGDKPEALWPDGTPRTGLALEYDIVIVDCSQRSNMQSDENMRKVATILGRDKMGVVVLTRTQWHERRKGLDVADEDALACFTSSEGGHWSRRRPVVLHKPMVRPLCLLAALQSAFMSIPGKEGALVEKRTGEDLLLLHGFLQKAAARKHRRKRQSKTSGPKFRGRVLLMEHNQINIHAVEGLMTARGGVSLDSAKTLEEAMVLLEKQPYDIVFLDCHIHDMEDPYAVVRKIRDLEGQAAEIIVTKNHLTQEEQDKHLAAGATECISRPLTVAKLEQFFKEHLIQVA